MNLYEPSWTSITKHQRQNTLPVINFLVILHIEKPRTRGCLFAFSIDLFWCVDSFVLMCVFMKKIIVAQKSFTLYEENSLIRLGATLKYHSDFVTILQYLTTDRFPVRMRATFLYDPKNDVFSRS